jgi:hypothetical protein
VLPAYESNFKNYNSRGAKRSIKRTRKEEKENLKYEYEMKREG